MMINAEKEKQENKLSGITGIELQNERERLKLIKRTDSLLVMGRSLTWLIRGHCVTLTLVKGVNMCQLKK